MLSYVHFPDTEALIYLLGQFKSLSEPSYYMQNQYMKVEADAVNSNVTDWHGIWWSSLQSLLNNSYDNKIENQSELITEKIKSASFTCTESSFIVSLLSSFNSWNIATVNTHSPMKLHDFRQVLNHAFTHYNKRHENSSYI